MRPATWRDIGAASSREMFTGRRVTSAEIRWSYVNWASFAAAVARATLGSGSDRRVSEDPALAESRISNSHSLRLAEEETAMTTHRFTRRTMLRGLGVSMALPWLESLNVWGDEARGTARRARPPSGWPCSSPATAFTARSGGPRGPASGMELGKVLAPLTDLREKMLFIRGLYNAEALKGNIHSSQTGNLLSGAPLASGGEIRSGTSVDQVLAQTLRPIDQGAQPGAGLREVEPVGAQELLDALQLAHLVDLADDADAAGTVSRAGLRSALQGRGPARRRERARLRPGRGQRLSAAQISTSDQRKLDEYLDSVRDVEQRIANAGKQGELQGWRPTLDKPNMPRPPEGIPQNIADHMRLMCDILVLGFQTDTTRITTLKLNNDHSSLRFPHLGVDYMIHHLLSHSDTADWLKVNQFFVEQLAYIARKLDAIQEGERTALDNSMILFCSSMLNGGHDATQLPVVMLGRGGGRIQTGRVLDYRDKPNRQMCRLYPLDDGQDGRPPRPLRRRDRAALGGVVLPLSNGRVTSTSSTPRSYT